MTDHTKHPKTAIPDPAKTLAKHGSHQKAFDLVIQQYLSGHIDFEIVGDPVPQDDGQNSVIYTVRRFDTNPSEAAQVHDIHD